MEIPEKKQIQNDFELLIKELERIHPNPYTFIKPKELTKHLNLLLHSYEQLTPKTLYFGLMKILSRIKDSHTRVKNIEKILTSPSYPIRIKILNQNFYISSIQKDLKNLTGSKLKSLNGIPVSYLRKIFSEILTHENEIVLNNAIEKWIHEKDILEYLNIVKDNQHLQIEVERLKKKVQLEINKNELYSPRTENIEKSETLKPKGLYWTQIYKDLSTYYLQYNECEDITKKEIENIIQELILSESKYIVVDLRNNLGGSSLILDPLTKFLYDNQEKYTPIVLISEKTYSAVIINALNILDCKNAISIGKTTSGSPTKFGQTKTIILPQTGIEIAISGKSFQEPGYNFGEPLKPTIETQQTIDQYLEAIDVDWIEYVKYLDQ